MGLFDGVALGEAMTNQSLQNQRLRDQLQTYPDLLRAQLQIAQAQGGILGAQSQYAPQTAAAQAKILSNTAEYAPKMSAADLVKAQQFNQYFPAVTQADIDSKNAFTANAPYQASAMLSTDPAAQMVYDRMRIIPKLISYDGGMTVQPAPSSNVPTQGGITGGIPGMPSGSAVSQAPPQNYPVLPGGLSGGQGAQIATQLSNGPTSAPQQISPQLKGLAAPIQTGIPSLDQMYAARMNNVIAQMSKDPRFGSAKGGAGGTYVSPTGAVSTNTNSNTTADQKTISAVQRVAPLLKVLSDNLSPFQTLSGEAKLKLGQAGNYILGQNNQAPNQYAVGQAALKTAPEGLLKAWGLNVTNESLKTMEDAIKPIEGESAEGYQNRIIGTLKTLQDNEDQAKGRLQKGTSLETSSQGDQSGMEFDIPSFENKEAFQNWYKGLTPDEKKYARSKIGA